MIAVFVFFFLLVIGTPIALVVLFTSLVGTLTYTTTAPNVVIAQMFAGMDTTTLLAVPFFIVAGMIASKGKTSEKLVQVMNLIFGRLPGGPCDCHDFHLRVLRRNQRFLYGHRDCRRLYHAAAAKKAGLSGSHEHRCHYRRRFHRHSDSAQRPHGHVLRGSEFFRRQAVHGRICPGHSWLSHGQFTRWSSASGTTITLRRPK